MIEKIELNDEVVAFVEEMVDTFGPCKPWRHDVFRHLGIDGDDAFEFMEAFSNRFAVDLNAYKWYFHHGEEGWPLARQFYADLPHVPVTLGDLVTAATTRRWPITYPAHEVPALRRPEYPMKRSTALLAFAMATGLVSFVLFKIWAW